ncbi:hypothetical protein [Psychrobacter sp. 230]|uniref:hypothetical protein n=1 Tax=Psychrobacter sp. 230 TaxID=2555884 RepID=UPI0010689367|nr:hypothetical protein [Psychrobacter sp. 230]TEW87506.1 hypothetical protein E2545_04545 [Psychrobacter sp. 230]|tara:strand:- start:429 stop:662 length:234 start_codon:yes stop_codon:yes gene_type:complete
MEALNQTATNTVFAKEVEIQRLSWFDALFATIKADIKNGDTQKAQKLADLGQYLAEDFQQYSEESLSELLAEKGGSL